MLKTISQLKDRVSGILKGLDLDTVTDLDGAIEQAARTLVTEIKIPEATGRQAVTLYGGVFDYEAPDTLFGTSLRDFRPQGVSRETNDRAYKKSIDVFDRNKNSLPNGYTLTVEYVNGVGVLRVATPKALPTATLDPVDDDDWTLSGVATGLVVDEITYYKSPASLRFQIPSNGVCNLTKSIDSQDLSDYENIGVAFLAFRSPDAVDITSITLQLGSSATAYDYVTATEGLRGAWKNDDWTLVPFDFADSLGVNTPDWSALDYAKIIVTPTDDHAVVTNFNLGALFISLPSPHELIYETAAIFLATGTTTPLQAVTADTDQILLSDPAYNCFAHEVALNIEPKRTDIQAKLYGSGNEIGLYARFRSENPSEAIKQTDSYYPIKSFRR